MTSTATLPQSSDLSDAVMSDATTRLKILQRLADLGMRLAEEVVERAVDSPYHPEPKHEPTRAFANVSRSVRLTLVLQEKMETRLIALRNGAALFAETEAGARASGGCGARARREVPDDIADDKALGTDRSTETLRERETERFDDLVSEPFETCLAAIRGDLGLKPGDEVPTDDRGVEAALETVLEAASDPWAGHRAPVYAMSAAAGGAGSRRLPDSG